MQKMPYEEKNKEKVKERFSSLQSKVEEFNYVRPCRYAVTVISRHGMLLMFMLQKQRNRMNYLYMEHCIMLKALTEQLNQVVLISKHFSPIQKKISP